MLKKGNVFHERDFFFSGRNGVQKLFYRTPFEKMFLDQKWDVFGSQFLIEDSFGIDHHDRTFGAEPIATGDDQLHFIRKPAVL